MNPERGNGNRYKETDTLSKETDTVSFHSDTLSKETVSVS
jgi:hypothetical protein